MDSGSGGVNYTDWIGKTEVLEEEIGVVAACAAAATLDNTRLDLKDGASLPPLWHWFYFLPRAPQSHLDHDGHPQRGGFLPPIAYPRRMFAGSRMTFRRPLVLGERARREGIIRNIVEKSGRSGGLVFVTVGYQLVQRGEVCIEEEQDIVYREPGPPIAMPQIIEPESFRVGAWIRQVIPDTRLLFRFSAVTFNAHRIHYDRDYACGEEGYPGLVVHGPLTAILLAELVRQHTTRPIVAFEFQGKAPLFDRAPFWLIGEASGTTVTLTARGPDGTTAMKASAELG